MICDPGSSNGSGILFYYFVGIIRKSLKSFPLAEFAIIFGYIILLNSFIGNTKITIKADAAGYYDYLPSLFIYKDIDRRDVSSGKHERIDSMAVYVPYGEHKVNKYPCGTALLQLPFFTLANAISEGGISGFEAIFHKAVFYSAIFYLFLSLVFMRKLLELYKIRKSLIIFSQVLLLFATGLINYTSFDAGFSHVYSLFAINAFFYFVISYTVEPGRNSLYGSLIFLALIILIRQANSLVLLFIPFLAGSAGNLLGSLKKMLQDRNALIVALLFFFMLLFIQSLLWYLQTGSWLVYSYQGEGFNFLHPEFWAVLFSYRKGLFVYTPVLFIALLSVFWFLYKRRYYEFISWILYFIILTWFLSSWWNWFYGCSFGLRAYIDYYAVFIIPFAIVLNSVSLAYRYLLIFFSLLTVPVNIIQTYQYKNFILHWDNMDREKYWKVFLRTSAQYRGILWVKESDNKESATDHKNSGEDQ